MRRGIFYLFLFLSFFQLASALEPCHGSFLRGNVNEDPYLPEYKIDLSDAIYLLNHLFRSGDSPKCLEVADANNDEKVDISDAVFLLNYLFLGGSEPLPNFGEGIDDPVMIGFF